MRITRKSLAALGCALLITAPTACTDSGAADVGTRTRRAVEKLGEREAVSFTARVDASAEEVYAFLRRNRAPRDRGPAPTRTDALLLSRMEVVFSFGADGPLKDTGRKDRVDSAATMSFGGRDMAAYKSIGEDFYVRVPWEWLAAETNRSHRTVAEAAELARSADELPPSLAAARDLLKGEWVQIDPEEFDQFARAVGGRYGERAERLADGVEVLQSAAAQHHIVGALRRTLGDHASFREDGRADGAERVRVTVPARDFARDLADALGPLERRFDGLGAAWLERAPQRRVSADLELRGGTLTGMTVDLAQFGERGDSAALPLTLTFAPGQAVRVEAPPDDPRWLDPQDVMAAALYEELGAAGS